MKHTFNEGAHFTLAEYNPLNIEEEELQHGLELPLKTIEDIRAL